MSIDSEIYQLFSKVKRPKEDNVVSDSSEEAIQLRNDLYSHKRVQVPLALVMAHINDLPMLTDTAYHYYLPRFLVATTEEASLKQFAFYYSVLCPNQDVMIFSQQQAQAVIDFLVASLDDMLNSGFSSKEILDGILDWQKVIELNIDDQSKYQQRFIDEIYHVFSQQSRPIGDELIDHQCDECFELRDQFSQYSMPDVPDKILQYQYMCMSLLSNRGFHYYLPSYLANVLEKGSDYFLYENILDPFHDLALFNSEEKNTVIKFITHKLNDILDDLNTPEEITDAIRIWQSKIPQKKDIKQSC